MLDVVQRHQELPDAARPAARCCPTSRSRSRRARPRRSRGRPAAARARCSTSSARSSRRRPARVHARRPQSVRAGAGAQLADFRNARDRLRVPGSLPAAAVLGARERAGADAGGAARQRRRTAADVTARARDADRAGRPGRSHRPSARRAVGRREAARRDRARADPAAAPAAVRRADRQSRSRVGGDRRVAAARSPPRAAEHPDRRHAQRGAGRAVPDPLRDERRAADADRRRKPDARGRKVSSVTPHALSDAIESGHGPGHSRRAHARGVRRRPRTRRHQHPVQRGREARERTGLAPRTAADRLLRPWPARLDGGGGAAAASIQARRFPARAHGRMAARPIAGRDGTVISPAGEVW